MLKTKLHVALNRCFIFFLLQHATNIQKVDFPKVNSIGKTKNELLRYIDRQKYLKRVEFCRVASVLQRLDISKDSNW